MAQLPRTSYYIVKDRKNEYYIDAADSLPRPLQLSEEEILKGVESIYTSQRDSSQHIPGIHISLLEHFETYYRDMSNMYRGRPQLPVWKITVDDPDRSVYYIHPETGIIHHVDTSSRWKYWSYTALHRMRLPGLNPMPPCARLCFGYCCLEVQPFASRVWR